jgi:hypothetical protein
VDAFSSLLEELARQASRPRNPPPVALPARAAPSQGLQLRSTPDRAFAKALNSQLAAAQEEHAGTRLRGLRPGMGCRLRTRAGVFQVRDIDPASGRVAIAPIGDDEKWPIGIRFDPPPEWVEANALERAPEHDAAGVAGSTMAKALDVAKQRRQIETNVADIRDRARRLVADTRQRLEKSFDAGEISGADVRKTEIALNSWCERMGL